MRAWGIGLILTASLALPSLAAADEKADAATCKRLGVPDQIALCNKTLQDLRARIRKSPNDADLYLARASVYGRIRDYPLAIDDLDRAIKLKPSEDVYLLRGTLHGMTRNPDGAIEDANRALRLNPKSADAYQTLGYAYTAKKESNRAIEAFTRAIALDPNQPHSYTARAAVYTNTGKKALAEADCQRALALMPKRDGDMGYDGKGTTIRCHPEWAK
jgi:tetratricopeptide (TPR) repeat protein